MRTMKALALLSGMTLLGEGAFAKGLDELSQSNPEGEEAAAEGDAEPAAAGEAKTAAPMVKSEASKALAEKLFLQTSFGWVKASKSKGEWSGGGMSDFTIGYKLAALSAQMPLYGTYRYAPVAVSGTEDDQSYRGVWETHFFGGRINYGMSQTMSIVGSAELGYTMVHLTPTDGLEQDEKHEAGGGQLALGGGADFQVIEKGFSAGPRLVAAFGSFTTIQVAGAVGFMF